jgi:aminoglycoside phosphotransferase (APT) family kinase protein
MSESTSEPTDALREFLDARVGDSKAISVEAMVGGGSCEIFALQRGGERWVLRRAPSHASSATAHDVLREFRILDAIKDEAVSIARPVLACDDPAVFGAPFYIMARIDGVPVRNGIPDAWTAKPEEQARALEQLVDALVAIHAVDWRGCGLGELAHQGPYLERQVGRWLSQLDSYGGRPLPTAARLASWLEAHRPDDQAPTLAHGDYKLDNVLFAEAAPPRLLAVVDWEMASIGDPLIDLAWAMIFHPGPEGTMPLGVAGTPGFDRARVPSRASLIARYGDRSGRDVSGIDWYDVFARWKLAIVLEGSYAKFLRGESKKPIHEYFGKQADLLLDSAASIMEAHV